MIQVFLLDDYTPFRAGARRALETAEDIVVVGEGDRAQGTASEILEKRPNVALLDIYLPDGNGIEVCRDVQAVAPEIRCLMLTHAIDDEPLFESIIAGAAGYLSKTVSPRELVDAVQIVAEGKSLIDPALLDRVLSRLRAGEDRLSRLTGRERDVLHLIGEGLTNPEIAEALQLAEQTIKNYVSRVLSKLEMGRIQAALYATEREHELRRGAIQTPSTDGSA